MLELDKKKKENRLKDLNFVSVFHVESKFDFL